MPDETKALEKTRISLSSLKTGSKIAEGGFAELYNVNDRHGQSVVLRQLKPEHRFNRKMRRAFRHGVYIRRLCGQHPNIVQYHGEGGSWFALPYEVIELINGDCLKNLIFNRHPAVHSHPLHILRQCAAAMMHIHQLGHLHLDIKPENFLVCFPGRKPEVKLSDFDLCQPITRKEAPKKFGGSLMYLAPEYLIRKEIAVTSDIFAFGVMAFNLYTGQMPFVGSVESLVTSGTYHIHYPVGLGAEAPEPVKELIDRCLNQYPKLRFLSAADLLATIDSVRRRQDYDSRHSQ